MPLDGSPQANAGLPLGAGLAQDLSLPILLLRAVPPLDGTRHAQRSLEDAERRLAGVAREVAGHDVPVTWRVCEGEPLQQIPAQVQSDDLLLFGFGSRPGLGALPRSFLEHTGVPVLLRRAGGRRVVHPTRVGSDDAPAAVDWASRFARRLGGTAAVLESLQALDAVDVLVLDRAKVAGLPQASLIVPILGV